MDNGPFDPSQGVPIDLVLSMRNQGLSPDQIVQSLQRQGFDPHQIYDALNQASIKVGVENVPPQYFSPGEYPQEQQPIQYEPPQQAPPQMAPPPMQGVADMDRMEEIAGAIVDEKWKDLTKTIERIMEWKDKVENRIGSLQQELDDLKNNYNNLHQGVLGKIGEYDKNMSDLGVEIKAMEKVFKEILPSLTSSVNELSNITKTMKK